jgi:hypothetical protein
MNASGFFPQGARQSPAVDVAVTHDDEWMSVLKVRNADRRHAYTYLIITQQDDENLPDKCELIERIFRKYRTYTTSGILPLVFIACP